MCKASPAGIESAICSDIILKIAATRAEWEKAFRLIYQSYLRSDLCGPNPCHIRITPYQLTPSTDIFVAKLRGEVICTLSLARDGELGLPMEKIYGEEILARRSQGLRLAEVTCLADRRGRFDRFFRLFCELSRLMVQFARKQGIDQLLIAVHPRHAALYRRYMGFKKIGNLKKYEAVRDNPAVALCLDLNEIHQLRPETYEEFFGISIPDDVLQSHPMSESDLRYFTRILEFANAADETDVYPMFAGFGTGAFEVEPLNGEDELLTAVV